MDLSSAVYFIGVAESYTIFMIFVHFFSLILFVLLMCQFLEDNPMKQHQEIITAMKRLFYICLFLITLNVFVPSATTIASMFYLPCVFEKGTYDTNNEALEMLKQLSEKWIHSFVAPK